MKEKLIIRNFGPIKNVELELGRFNVLIGEQATGKSTVAKVLAMCRYFSYLVDTSLTVTAGDAFLFGSSSWGVGQMLRDGSFIYYKCHHYSVSFEFSYWPKRIWNPNIDEEESIDEPSVAVNLEPISDEFRRLLGELDKIRPNRDSGYGFSDIDWHIPSSFYVTDVSRVLDNPFYIPTERGLQSVFSLGKNSLPNLADSLFLFFEKTYDLFSKNFKKDSEIKPLNVVYKNENGRGFVKNSSHGYLNLANAASGYQSTIPIVLLIKYYSEIKKKAKTFIIEEPELNLFPAAQSKVVEFLSESVSLNGHSFFINTHSPYVLTTLSNLMYAYKVGQQNEAEAEKIIPKRSWLNPDEVSAYMLLPDGTCEDIFDREEDLIKADKIDEISGVLNRQFDSLINIELSLHEQD